MRVEGGARPELSRIGRLLGAEAEHGRAGRVCSRPSGHAARRITFALRDPFLSHSGRRAYDTQSRSSRSISILKFDGIDLYDGFSCLREQNPN